MHEVTPSDSPELHPHQRRRRVNWCVRGTIAAVFLLGGLSVLGWDWWSFREDLLERVRRIEQTHGIKIGYGSPTDFWVPPFKPEDATAPGVIMEPVELRNMAIALDGADSALKQYPPGFVAKLIRAIFICGELRMDGEVAGGTVGPLWIILVAPSDRRAEDIRLGSLLGVHHELSSLVLRVNPVFWSEWAALTPLDWNFVDDAGSSLRRGNDAAPALETGFLSAYGATNLENDFNTYAETLFTEPARLERLAQQYPQIRRKLDLALATYVAADPRFADQFRRMGLEQSARDSGASH